MLFTESPTFIYLIKPLKNNYMEETIKLPSINIWKHNNKHLQIILRFKIMMFDCKLFFKFFT